MLVLRDESLLARSISEIGKISGPPVCIIGAAQSPEREQFAHESGIRFLPDLAPDGVDRADARAAVFGIYSALKYCSTEYALVAACDMPFVTSALFEFLIKRAVETPDAAAIIPRQADGYPQFLCGVYKKDACLRTIERSIVDGHWKLLGIFERLLVDYVEFSELAHDEQVFLNINTMADLERAKEILEYDG